MNPQMFRKKPVEIEAMRFAHLDDADAIALWCGGRRRTSIKPSDLTDQRFWIDIPTLEGVMSARLGDWIIKGVKGEFYPCKPDVFEMTYESMAEVPDRG